MATRKKSTKKKSPSKKTKARPKTRPRAAARRKPALARKAARPKAKRAPVARAAPKSLPAIEVATTGGQRVRLDTLKGKPVVIYFYPKDDTPGCTTEGCDIRDHWGAFRGLNVTVLGVSRDGLESHEKFKQKYRFPFELISDPDEKLCRLFGVIREKSLYGRKFLGVDRSTFVFDRAGALRREFRGVKVAGHVTEVLDTVKQL
jgi:peroxiredoxin Q/BCP